MPCLVSVLRIEIFIALDIAPEYEGKNLQSILKLLTLICLTSYLCYLLVVPETNVRDFAQLLF